MDYQANYNYSIIVPYRDKYELFLKAVESIPDREDIQIIIVDNSPETLHQELVPSKIHSTIEYKTSSPTKGAGCARNVGLSSVKGRFVLFLDADDYFTPDAFKAFDKYTDKEFDIVFFKPTSINLVNGKESDRHTSYANKVDYYLSTRNEDRLRCRWEVPWAKMFNASYLLSGGFKFDEVKVSNDVYFSLMTGCNARTITADEAIVYVVTEGEKGTSLTRSLTRDNWFIRYQVMVRVNKYLKSIGKYQYRIRLLGALRIALNEFGIKEFFRFLNYARNNGVGIF